MNVEVQLLDTMFIHTNNVYTTLCIDVYTVFVAVENLANFESIIIIAIAILTKIHDGVCKL